MCATPKHLVSDLLQIVCETEKQLVSVRLARRPKGRPAAAARDFSRARRLSITAACLPCAFAVCAAAAADDPGDPVPVVREPSARSRGFSLGLGGDDLPSLTGHPPGRGFDLGLVEGGSGARTDDEPLGVVSRELVLAASPDREGRPAFDVDFGFDDGAGVLITGRSVDPVELHLMAELERVIPGYRPQGLLFSLDVDEIVTRVGDWWRRRRERRLPPAASLPLDGSVGLVVRSANGEIPAHISVVALTDGWVGDAVHSTCGATGRCEVEGLPSVPSTLLVRGNGAAVVPWRPADRELTVRLRPTGTVRLAAPSLEHCGPLNVRVVEQATGLVVPVLRWLNPQRGAWVPLSRAALPLVLPVGVYRVEVARDRGSPPVETVVVEVDGVAEVDVEACAAQNP